MILSGKEPASALKAQTREKVKEFYKKYSRVPTLSVVLVGENPASIKYVEKKTQDCKDCGISCDTVYLGAETSEQELIQFLEGLNKDNTVDGILVQMPLPKHINTNRVLSTISPDKDVDGLTPVNAGRLWTNNPENKQGLFLKPCTPEGSAYLLDYYLNALGRDMTGCHAVIIGRSNLVGKPMAAVCLARDMTVTVCHSKTVNLKSFTLLADIIVTAAGTRNLLTSDMVSPGTVVLDVSINFDESGKLCGDCDKSELRDDCMYTPVPGGIGLMTRAQLMANVLIAAELRQSKVQEKPLGGWISIDTPPKDNGKLQKFLVCRAQPSATGGNVLIDSEFFTRKFNGFNNITHWMPLPDPPTAE